MMTNNPLAKFKNCNISADVKLNSDDITIGEGVVIASGVSITAKKISIGSGSKIERGTTICGLSGTMDEFSIGDRCLIGFNNQIMAPVFSMGDYSQIHNSGLNSGYKPLLIGHNCWIGQGTILNCTENLTIGNNVRIGTNSRLWTHVASGELLEGCTLLGFKPLVIEDNVWIVGGAVISPGLVLGRNSIIMTGAVLTKSTEPFHTYAGMPAKDVTDKLSFWEKPSQDDKFKMIQGFVAEFIELQPQYSDVIHAIETVSISDLQQHNGHVVFTLNFTDWKTADECGVSIFDLTTKTYLKQRSKVEIDWIRWSLGYRARFTPHQR